MPGSPVPESGDANNRKIWEVIKTAIARTLMLNAVCTGFGRAAVRQVHCTNMDSAATTIASGRLRLTIPIRTNSALTETMPRHARQPELEHGAENRGKQRTMTKPKRIAAIANSPGTRTA